MNKSINFLVLLLIVLSSCSVRESETPTRASLIPTSVAIQPTMELMPISDGGLISGKPCASPCFFGVRIGETPLNQVVPTLKNYGVSPCELFNERIVVCGNQINIGADSSTSIVNGIQYNPSIAISVGKIIEKYEDPNSIIVELDNTGTPEKPKLIVFLLWDSIRMIVELPEVPIRENTHTLLKAQLKCDSLTLRMEQLIQTHLVMSRLRHGKAMVFISHNPNSPFVFLVFQENQWTNRPVFEWQWLN